MADVYARGTSKGSPGIDSILESAFTQGKPGGINQWHKGGAPAGLNAQALYALTGHAHVPTPTVITSPANIQQANATERPITAETFLESEATVLVDGAEHTITISGFHAYAVTGADENGVYITESLGLQ